MATLSMYKKEMKLMGNHFEITVVAEEEAWAYAQIDKGVNEIKRIEKLRILQTVKIEIARILNSEAKARLRTNKKRKRRNRKIKHGEKKKETT